MKLFFLTFCIIILSPGVVAFAQGCCSGGSGSPIAGGTSQGVLAYGQAEAGTNFQYINSKKFLTGDSPAMNFLDNFNIKYLYTRLAYGVTDHLTMSLESGYYINKTQIAINKTDREESRGIGDLIIFPRYKVYEHNTEKTRDEITVGLGYKIPVGKYLDSTLVYTNPVSGAQLYVPKPPAVMPTTGAQDVIFYAFGYRGYPEKQFRLFTNALYIHKGWNGLGERFGDYASLSLFAGKTIYKTLGVTLQLKGEWIDGLQYDKNVNMLASYNIDVNSFGSKKVAIAPQVSYAHNNFSVYALSEFPLYQYINGTAIASQYLFTIGLSYRFSMLRDSE